MTKRRYIAAGVAVAVAAGVAGLVSATTAGKAGAASSRGGAISRTEVIQRAQNWVNRKLTYSQAAWSTDVDGAHTYRKDCSGLVSMAWHLGSSLVTNEFLDRARANNGMHVISRDSLEQGDAMVRDSDGYGPDGHIEMFSRWVNAADHNKGAYVFSFNMDGETVENPNARTNFGNLGLDGLAELKQYTPIRYNNIQGGGSAAPVTGGLVAADVTGDGKAEMLARKPDGTLLMYTNSGQAASPYHTSAKIGSSFNGFSWFQGADVTGDRRADVVAAKPDGTLWLYVNSGKNTSPYGTGTKIGVSWNMFKTVVLADVNGDRRADAMGVKSDGSLWLYVNRGGGAPFGTSTKIGVGWQMFNKLVAADVTGDGRADLLGRKGDGTLWLYANRGGGAPFGTSTKIGTGWQMFNRIVAADVTGDGRADLVSAKPDGTLWLYTNRGANNAPFGPNTKIGVGWQVFA